MSRPAVTKTTHILPFQQLSPLDFERLCLWLVRREGFEKAEHLGVAGGEQGRDILARRSGRRVVFQCKRVNRLDPSGAEKEIEKLKSLPAESRPDDIIFVVSTAVSVQTRDRARQAWGDAGSCEFWAGTELDERVKRHKDLLREFFQILPLLHQAAPCFMVPYNRNPYFTGREDELKVVHSQLKAEGTCAPAVRRHGGKSRR